MSKFDKILSLPFVELVWSANQRDEIAHILCRFKNTKLYFQKMSWMEFNWILADDKVEFYIETPLKPLDGSRGGLEFKHGNDIIYRIYGRLLNIEEILEQFSDSISENILFNLELFNWR